MAAKEQPYDILLLGKTGMGKSTTGNHLVRNPRDVTRIVDVLYDLRNPVWKLMPVPADRESGRLTKFEHASGRESCTDRPDVLYNPDTGIRVMDTKGFADSKMKQGTSSFTNNLTVMRSILTWQSATNMSFRRVLYFLPSRTPLERLDGNLQEEIEIMLHFFGAGIFNCMVLVFTLYPKSKNGITPDDVCGEDWESMTKDAMYDAIQRTAERLEVNLPENFKCPPVVFIPKDGPSHEVTTTVKRASVLVDEPCSLAFRKTTCTKCAASLKFPPTTIVDNPTIGKEIGHDPITVKYDNDAPIEFAESMCHPGFVSKYSFVEKLGGSLAHIASLGMLFLAERVNDKDYLPFFGNSDEVCITCKEAPSSENHGRGCMKVNTYWMPKKALMPIRVNHCSGK